MKQLTEYHKKRDFKKTSEPLGTRRKVKSKLPLYVIQQHAARRLHFDLRLEDEGVLKSWAVPKGPPVRRNEKRLAIQTEDHPMDYARFEGFIPKGEYGGGEVIVWDNGSYENRTVKEGKLIPIKTALKKGSLHFWVEGKKLKGLFALHRIKREEKSWVLIKLKETVEVPSKKINFEQSVISKLTLRELQIRRKELLNAHKGSKKKRKKG